MSIAISELDRLQEAYKTAVDAWVEAIRTEEELASGDHSETQIDEWEEAGFHEEDLRKKVKHAKKDYEDALRKHLFNF